MIDCKPLWLSSSPVRGVGGVQPSVFRGGQRSVGVLGLSISGVVWQAAAQTGGAGRHPTVHDTRMFLAAWVHFWSENRGRPSGQTHAAGGICSGQTCWPFQGKSVSGRSLAACFETRGPQLNFD